MWDYATLQALLCPPYPCPTCRSTRSGMEMSPIKIVKNPDGSLQRAAMTQSALAKVRRSVAGGHSGEWAVTGLVARGACHTAAAFTATYCAAPQMQFVAGVQHCTPCCAAIVQLRCLGLEGHYMPLSRCPTNNAVGNFVAQPFTPSSFHLPLLSSPRRCAGASRAEGAAAAHPARGHPQGPVAPLGGPHGRPQREGAGAGAQGCGVSVGWRGCVEGGVGRGVGRVVQLQECGNGRSVTGVNIVPYHRS